MNEIDVIRDFSGKFDLAGIQFMLTGSMAMNYYAVSRMTRDIDVVVAIGAAEAPSISRLFATEYYVSEEAVREAVLHESMFNLIHLASVIKVDCIVRKDTEYRRAEFQRRQRIMLRDFPTWITSKEDLIISKLFWAKDSHSELQLRDVKNLLAAGFDVAYVDKWTKLLGVDKLLKECLHD